jgi:hypothetical protein
VEDFVVLMGHVGSALVCQLLRVAYTGLAHFNMSFANTICEKTFSTSRTSKSLSLSPLRTLLEGSEYDRCDGWRSLSLMAQRTWPGGNMFDICILASSVLRTAIN